MTKPIIRVRLVKSRGILKSPTLEQVIDQDNVFKIGPELISLTPSGWKRAKRPKPEK